MLSCAVQTNKPTCPCSGEMHCYAAQLARTLRPPMRRVAPTFPPSAHQYAATISCRGMRARGLVDSGHRATLALMHVGRLWLAYQIWTAARWQWRPGATDWRARPTDCVAMTIEWLTEPTLWRPKPTARRRYGEQGESLSPSNPSCLSVRVLAQQQQRSMLSMALPRLRSDSG